MRADLDQAEVLRDAAVIGSPGFDHVLRVIFGLDLGDDPAVSVIDKQNNNLERLPRRSASYSLRRAALSPGRHLE